MEKYEKRKYMFCVKSTFCKLEWSNQGQQEFICFVHSTSANYPYFNVKKVSRFTIPLRICLFFKGMKYIFFTICTLFNLKKIKRY